MADGDGRMTPEEREALDRWLAEQPDPLVGQLAQMEAHLPGVTHDQRHDPGTMGARCTCGRFAMWGDTPDVRRQALEHSEFFDLPFTYRRHDGEHRIESYQTWEDFCEAGKRTRPDRAGVAAWWERARSRLRAWLSRGHTIA